MRRRNWKRFSPPVPRHDSGLTKVFLSPIFSDMNRIEKIYFASSNSHKKAEMQRLIMDGVTITLPCEEGLSFDPDENGSSFIENSLIKAKALYDIVRAPVLADDSGLVVDALGGRPGIHTARYGCTDERKLTSREQYMMLLDEMKGRTDRTARFVSACTLMLSADRIYIVQETVEGSIALQPAGLHGFGYDPVFIVEDTGLTASQLSDEEKDRYSHRGKAVRKLNSLLASL